MDKWDIVHTYRRLVEEGKADPLTCTICGARVYTRLASDDDPMLSCVAGHNAFPGASWYARLDEINRSAT